jgi:hypothetical protein
MTERQILPVRGFIKQYGTNWTEYVERMRSEKFPEDLKIPIKWEKKFGKAFEMMKLFCF